VTAKYTSKYTPPTLTVDLVLFSIIENQLKVVVMQRPNQPFKGAWALPGGYAPAGETTIQALTRITLEKTNIHIAELAFVEQLYAFDTVARDPRGHAVSIAYVGGVLKLNEDLLSNQARFFPVNELPEITFDHHTIIHTAHKHLANEVQYGNRAASFLTKIFTLTELQNVHEIILGLQLDKRNFRKKILSTGVLKDTKRVRSGGIHRPARLYTFNA
jgi:8-oxo-dGTP diphosphatase